MLFAGRLHVVKGVDILLRAWSLVHRQLPGMALRLAGDGAELESLRALSEELAISDSVWFLGYQKQEEVAALCRGAELVVIPSRNEGHPRIALEAGACGAVCVASRVGGIPEAIADGKTGFLTDPESPPALAEGMLRALHLPAEERRGIGQAASKYVEQKFSREAVLASHQDVFRSILRKRSTAVGLGQRH